MSEFAKFINQLKELGIPHSIHHAPGHGDDRKLHQKILKDGGFNLTALALTGVVMGDIMLLFSVGQAHWTDDDKGHGPDSVFLYQYNMKTGERAYRTTPKGTYTGIQALAIDYNLLTVAGICWK